MGCLRPGKPITSDGYCEPCVRYMYGYDQAEEKAVQTLIGGAVRAALAMEIPAELIVLAVHEAIETDHQDEMGKLADRAYNRRQEG
jgi:hypothetical protein